MTGAAAARYGVLGWPVGHSRSPAMMRAAGLERYQRLPAAPEVFDDTVRALGAAGFRGANVTIPHKEAALALATSASDAARAIGAANTLSFGDDGSIVAENTDAPGLLAALGSAPASALVLGAGGSARAAVWALTQAGTDVSVWNRTPERGRGLDARVVTRAVAAELLVNCTSVGLDDLSSPFKDLPLTVDGLGEYATVVDLVYRTGGTALTSEAERRGVSIIDGIEILVRQGALSFCVWTGLPAPLETMRAAARAA
ncbi:MAG TPA: shikimate dehydrogenase [Solirubrobacteraceae bacterium]|jgi:shikimate dehydrogenase|nr:shikimate dehydrogenase [Solirubrobacteraceae bacterium]